MAHSTHGRDDKCVQLFKEYLMVEHRHAYENNKIDLKDAGCVNVNWIRLAQDRDLSIYYGNSRFYKREGLFLTRCFSFGISRRNLLSCVGPSD